MYVSDEARFAGMNRGIAASSLSDVLSSAIFVRPCTASRSYFIRS